MEKEENKRVKKHKAQAKKHKRNSSKVHGAENYSVPHQPVKHSLSGSRHLAASSSKAGGISRQKTSWGKDRHGNIILDLGGGQTTEVGFRAETQINSVRRKGAGKLMVPS